MKNNIEMADENDWLISKEAKAFAKIKDCDLIHHRLAGKLDFKKVGNSFLYKEEDVLKNKDIP